MINLKSRNSGFTLIEVLLYISIVSLLLSAVGVSSQAFLEARLKNQVIADVNNDGSRAMNFILQALRNADSITGPTAGNTSDTLTLVVPDASKSPTIFKLETDGRMTIKEGSGDTIDLTNLSKVLVARQSGDSGIFSNLSRTTPVATPGVIRARYNVSHIDQSGVNIYFQNFNANFQGAASLR